MAFGASLRRRRVLVALARLARQAGVEAWIVGGAPRDGLLGRTAPDVDVAVSGLAESLARGLEKRGFGTAVAISDASPRVFRVAGRVDLDLAELEGSSILQDLARRDFTVNAIAIELGSGLWVDPFGGAEDLARRRLRAVRESNLGEDPLRAFRAARFYATHGLLPDRRTSRACRAVAPRLSEVAPERIRTELARMLEARRVATAFRWAARADVLAPALGLEVSSRRLASAAQNLERLDRCPGAGRLPADRLRALRLAAIADGIGLPPAAAAQWLRRRRHGRSEAGSVATLLELARSAPAVRRSRAGWAWLQDAGAVAGDALLLLETGRPRRRPRARRLRQLAARGRRGPVVTGSDVVAWLDLPPGPRVGQLLRQVRIEALRGTVRSRNEARRWLARNRKRSEG